MPEPSTAIVAPARVERAAVRRRVDALARRRSPRRRRRCPSPRPSSAATSPAERRAAARPTMAHADLAATQVARRARTTRPAGRPAASTAAGTRRRRGHDESRPGSPRPRDDRGAVQLRRAAAVAVAARATRAGSRPARRRPGLPVSQRRAASVASPRQARQHGDGRVGSRRPREPGRPTPVGPGSLAHQPARARSSSPNPCAVDERLGHVLGLDLPGAGDVGDRPRDLHRAIEPASGEREASRRPTAGSRSGVGRDRRAARRAARQLRVARPPRSPRTGRRCRSRAARRVARPTSRPLSPSSPPSSSAA